MVYICPKKFPLSVAMALAAISVDTAHEKDRLSRACLATLCELGMYLSISVNMDFNVFSLLYYTLDK